MAVDTRDKRASAIGIALAFAFPLPLADGTIAGVDKQHTAFSYRGIAAGAPVVVKDDTHSTTLNLGGYSIPPVTVPDKQIASTDLTDCNVYEAQICTRLEFNTPIGLVNDYDAQVDFPVDYKNLICTRNDKDTSIDAVNDFNTIVGCS